MRVFSTTTTTARVKRTVKRGMAMGKAHAKRSERTTVAMIRKLGERLSALGDVGSMELSHGERFCDPMDAMLPFELSSVRDDASVSSAKRAAKKA